MSTEKPSKKNVLWEMTADVAIKFFEECEKRHLTKEEDRVKLLLEFTKKGDMKRVWTTGRSKEEIIKDMSKEHRVLDMTQKEEDNES